MFKSQMFNLPNILTLLRILMVPLLVVVLLTKFEGKEFVGLAVFLVAALTDVLDGYIARRYGLITPLGKLLDPAADKILTSAAFISLVEMGVAPAWMVVTIIAREFAISTLRTVAAGDRVVIAASWSGKVKTISQVVAISLLIVHEKLDQLAITSRIALWVALVLSIYSGIEYAVAYARGRHGVAEGPIAPSSEAP